MNRTILLISIFLSALFLAGCAPNPEDAPRSRPNIIFLLTDDQDSVLDSMKYMPKTCEILGEHGVSFDHAFVTTPVCCPSRSSFVTGRYIHNLGVHNNSVAGNCSGKKWQQGPETRGVATFLQRAGYRTAFMGKYLNDYGSPSVGGVEHVP